MMTLVAAAALGISADYFIPLMPNAWASWLLLLTLAAVVGTAQRDLRSGYLDTLCVLLVAGWFLATMPERIWTATLLRGDAAYGPDWVLVDVTALLMVPAALLLLPVLIAWFRVR